MGGALRRWVSAELALAVLVAALGVALIAAVRAPLVQVYGAQARAEGESALPAPEHAILLSLGHREAFADFLFGHALVAYGISFQEKRRFELAGRYLDIITTLAPKLRQAYLYADTLLTMQSEPARLVDFQRARELQERGLAELPLDTELWSVAGQYAAYLAAPHLEEPLRSEYRALGAKRLARACELASENANIPYHCITAAGMLSKSGERDAVIRMLSRMLAVSDDDEIKKRVSHLLKQFGDEENDERYARRTRALNEAWQGDLPFVSRNLLSLMGPPVDVWGCTGLRAFSSPGCHTSWSTWAEALESSSAELQNRR